MGYEAKRFIADGQQKRRSPDSQAMIKDRKLIIVGTSSFAEIAFEYFEFDSRYKVVCFAVERDYIKSSSLHGLNVVPLESIQNLFNPDEYYFFCAITYQQLNRLRSRLMRYMLSAGFKPASYISSNAFVWKNVKLGDHCFVFEDNTIQPFCVLENNVILWSGNHIGHHSVVQENVFVSSHVTISGHCTIGRNSFLGVNSTLANNIIIGCDNWIGPSSLVLKNTEANSLLSDSQSSLSKVSTLRFFKINGNELD